MILSKYVSRGVLYIRIKYESPHDLNRIMESLKLEHPELNDAVIPTKEFMEVLAYVKGYSGEIQYPTALDMVKEVVVEQLNVRIDEEDEIDIDDLF